MTWTHLSKIKNLKRMGNGSFTGKCPAHVDKINSLSIKETTDNVLLHCHAGCSIEQIVSALGITISDLYFNQKQNKKKTVAIYQYKDLQGNVLHETVRYEPKGFSQRVPDGKGEYIYNLKNITPIIYNLKTVTEAIREGKIVYIVEGEKDCDNLGKFDLVGTTSPMGAGKWKDYYSDYLTNAFVVIIPDNDSVGQEHSIQVAKSLYGKAKSIKIINLKEELPNFPPKGDITDFFHILGKTKGIEKLNKIINITPKYTLEKTDIKGLLEFKTVSAKNLQEMELLPTKFIINNILSAGLHILAAPPKYGKSWLMIDWGIKISSGDPIWNNNTLKSNVLYLALEDNLNRLQDRMAKILKGKQAPSNFHYTLKANTINDGILEQLESHIKRYPNTGLVIIDTFQKIRGCGGKNMYASDYQDAGKLKEFADKHKIAILLIHHLRKMQDETDPFNTISGTTGLTGCADTIFVLKKDKRQDCETILYATGRDIEPIEAIITFDKTSYTWQLISTDAVSFKEEQEFNQDSLVVFLKQFITFEKPHWEGTAEELWEEFLKTKLNGTFLNYPTKPNIMSRRLNELSNKLHKISIHVTLNKWKGKQKQIILNYTNDTNDYQRL